MRKLIGTSTVLGLTRAPVSRLSAAELAKRIRKGDTSLAHRLSADGGSYGDEQRLWYARDTAPSLFGMRLAKAAFGLTAHEVRFVDPKDRREVYEWLGAAAAREVPLNAQMQLILADRTKISIGWEIPFEAPVGSAPFHGLGGSAAVAFLSRIGTFDVLESRDELLVRVPLKARLSMWLYVPRSSQRLASNGYGWVSKVLQLTGSRRLPAEIADLHLPKFSVDATSSVVATARDAGARDLGIAGILSIVPPLSKVLQVTQFAVTEQGISMSATTVAFRKKKAQRQPRKIVIDRPFGFLVRDDAAGELLLVGSVVQL